MLLVQLLSPDATTPVRATPESAGYDLFSSVTSRVPSFGQSIVETGIAVQIPSGHYGRLVVRSGICARYSVHVGAGVIDQDYRGPLRIIMFNLSDQDFLINKGQKVAQLILEKISTPTVQIVDSLSVTERGSGGFGSTGS